jgi:guanylate kinase
MRIRGDDSVTSDRRRGKLFVLSGPSGAGKTALVDRLRVLEPHVHYCITATTRPPRAGEEHGVHYYFLSEAEFRELKRSGGLLEYARIPPGGSRRYGTPSAQVVEALDRGDDVLANVDVQGAASIKRRFPDAVLIFLRPPDIETLRRRLENRGTESAEDLVSRLQNARLELTREGEFDQVVVNADGELERAVERVASIIRAAGSYPSEG